jgi:hypothetical protein
VTDAAATGRPISAHGRPTLMPAMHRGGAGGLAQPGVLPSRERTPSCIS